MLVKRHTAAFHQAIYEVWWWCASNHTCSDLLESLSKYLLRQSSIPMDLSLCLLNSHWSWHVHRIRLDEHDLWREWLPSAFYQSIDNNYNKSPPGLGLTGGLIALYDNFCSWWISSGGTKKWWCNEACSAKLVCNQKNDLMDSWTKIKFYLQCHDETNKNIIATGSLP